MLINFKKLCRRNRLASCRWYYTQRNKSSLLSTNALFLSQEGIPLPVVHLLTKFRCLVDAVNHNRLNSTNKIVLHLLIIFKKNLF